MIKKLEEFNNFKIEVVQEDGTHYTNMLWESLGGFDFYPEMENGIYGMYDLQDPSIFVELGTTLEEALNSLDSYNEYFNNLNDEGDEWATLFLAHYLTKNEDEVKDYVRDFINCTW